MTARAAIPQRASPSALLSDVWYTLVYYPPVDRARVEAERRAVWENALSAAGLGPGELSRAVDRVELEAHREELRGRTPPLARRIRRVARSLRISLDVRRMVRDFDAIGRRCPPRAVPGALAALRDLRARGYRLGLVSNVVFESAAGARRMLRHRGLRDRVDAVVLSADDGVAKPDPRPFLRCLKRLGVPAANAWYIGDMPNDVVGARAAGLRPIRFVGPASIGPRRLAVPRARARPDFDLRRWSELPGRLERAGATRRARVPASSRRSAHG